MNVFAAIDIIDSRFLWACEANRLTQAIQARLLNPGFNVTPLVNITVLTAP
ncbi:hypothetical protein ACQ4M3_06170 [Leptolyngbya sp. AN03gr2]|uniref:hypothetical protein n=1 Tax=unclassified Leptolyngbya TaxID=2650499 RepID=UPI003D31BA29